MTTNVQIKTTLSVMDFGAVGDGVTPDDGAIQRAINAHQATPGSKLIFPPFAYSITNSLILGSGPCNIEGFGATLVNAIPGFGQITTTTPPDTSLPSTTSLGPMRGACFYFTQQLLYPKIKGLTFQSFRFAIACYNVQQSPEFNENAFQYCNVGVFFYSGSQNTTLWNNTSFQSNCVLIAAATCFASGAPFAGGDNGFCDGTTIGNGGGGYGSFDNLLINPAFDQWFIGSILQPSVVSYGPYGSNTTYNDATGAPYLPTDPHCWPSGRVFFIPMRNPRDCFGFHVENLDMRNGGNMGCGLVNCAVHDFSFHGAALEQVWTSSQPYPAQGFIEAGAIMNGQVDDVTMNLAGTSVAPHPFICYTGRNAGGGPAQNLEYISHPSSPLAGQAYTGWLKNSGPQSGGNALGHYRGIDYQFNQENFGPYYQPGTGGGVNFSWGPGGTYATDNNKFNLLESAPLIFDLPSTNGSQFSTDAIIAPPPGFAGFVKVSVLNLTEGAWDTAEFYIQPSPVTGEDPITTAIVANGAAFIPLNTGVQTNERYARFNLAPGVDVALDYMSGDNMYVIGGVAGLSAPLPSGSTVASVGGSSSAVIKPFTRGWVAFGTNWNVGPVVGASYTQLVVKNRLFNYAETNTVAALRVVLQCSQFPYTTPEKVQAAAPPTTGLWQQGAIVWNSNPTAGAYIGWVCVATGTPGTWQGFGLIA